MNKKLAAEKVSAAAYIKQATTTTTRTYHPNTRCKRGRSRLSPDGLCV